MNIEEQLLEEAETNPRMAKIIEDWQAQNRLVWMIVIPVSAIIVPLIIYFGGGFK
ncbi:MAG: hypothetical protein AABY22_36225 [Nanoarchaeota archaeon]